VNIDGNTFLVPTHAGRVREANPTTLASVIQSVKPGDQILLRSGTYSGKYDANGWNESNFVLNAAQSGTAAQPISIKAYPGEVATIVAPAGRPNFYMGRQNLAEACNFWTISDLTLRAQNINVDGGGVTSGTGSPESGGTDGRVVGCVLQMTLLGHGDAGQVELQGDRWKIWGNDFQNDYARAVDNMNHSIYLDCGSDSTDIAYNTFIDRREGFVMMVHQDGTPMNYTDNRFHHNYVKARKNGDMRGVSSSNVDNASSFIVEDNYFENASLPGFGPLTVYRGTVTARRNVFVNCAEPIEVSALFGGTCRLIMGSGANANVWNGSPFTTQNIAYDGRTAGANLTVEAAP
jgi:hypothetical protein